MCGVSMIGVSIQCQPLEVFVDTDLDTLATALYARIDDVLKDTSRVHPDGTPGHVRVGEPESR